MENLKPSGSSKLQAPGNYIPHHKALQIAQSQNRLASSKRRSRSCTDLPTASKRPDLSSLKKPLVGNGGSSNITKHSATLTSTIDLPKKPKISQRIASLKTTTNTITGTIPKQPAAAASRPGFKRTAATTTAVEDASKPKVPKPTVSKPVKLTESKPAKPVVTKPPKPAVFKPAKPAPYDFKARFNLLAEKHKNLVETHRESQQKSEAFDSLQKNYTSLLGEKEELAQTCDKALEDLACLQMQNKQLMEERELSKRENKKLQNEHNALNFTYLKIKVDHENLQKTEEYYKNNLNSAKREIDSLQKELQEYRGFLQSYQEEKRLMHNEIQDLKGTIRVFCRVRPQKPDEDYRLLCNITFVDECTLEIKKMKESINQISGRIIDFKQEFNFDKVFPPEASQAEVFEELSSLVQSALDGYHVCVFAYGQTGSGKTYTMQGNDTSKEYFGMIPRTINLIFNSINKLSKLGWVYTVAASFLEIYNENVKDLLDRDNKEHLDILFNEGKGTTVRNLTIREVESAEKLEVLMALANRNRVVAATNFNEHSSRSHAVTKITLKGENQEMKLCYVGSLSLVDLAGSESAKTSTNERMPETKNINKSLSILGTVMSALHNKENHIPYRNSKLTYLLQSSLGGNSKTLMFVNVSPFQECYAETINSLRFASKVKEVKIASRRNKNYLQREHSNL